jgi:hypothetical protein
VPTYLRLRRSLHFCKIGDRRRTGADVGHPLHRGKGGWMDANNRIVKEEVDILMVSGSYGCVQEIAALGKYLLGPTAVYVKRPDGSTIL